MADRLSTDDLAVDHPDDQPAQQPNRRTVLLGAGALGSAAVLAACGTGGTGNPDTVTGNGAGNPDLGPTSEIPVGGGKIFTDQNVVVTQPTKDTFKGFSATCTHQGCQVGRIADGTIDCMCHGSRFSIVDGSVTNGPARRPLGKANITVAGGEITLA